MSTGQPRPFVPTSQRDNVISSLHDLSHSGIRSTHKLVAQRFVWNNMMDHIKNYVLKCDACNRSKVQRHIHQQYGTFKNITQRFEWIHMDIIGPLPNIDGYQYVLTIIDRFTRWPEVCPLKQIDEQTVVDAFVATWVSRYGVPANVTTDRGKQFISQLSIRF